MIDRALARGEIPPGSDPDLLLDMAFGPVYHRYLNTQLPLTDGFARGIATMVASAAEAGAAVTAPAEEEEHATRLRTGRGEDEPLPSC
jgi:predicted nucleotidyltransferase